jgi:PAS domain S-box-containing protein
VTDFALVAPLGGLVVIAFVYLRRLSSQPAAAAWGTAWLALYAAGAIASFPDLPPLVRGTGDLLGALFAALLLGGALALRHGRFPDWALGLGLGLGLFDMALAGLGHLELAQALAIPLELPFTVGAAAVVWRTAREHPGSFPEQALGPALALLALVNAVDPVARLMGLPMTPVLIGWIATALAAGLLQVAAFVERGRARERRLLAEQSLLHRISRYAERGDTRSVLEGIVTDVARTGCFDAFGIWLLSEDGSHLELAARMRHEIAFPPELERMPTDAPLARRALLADEPVYVQDAGRLEGPARAAGLQSFAAVALRAYQRGFGLLVLGRREQWGLDEEDRRLVVGLSDEIARVLSHVRSVEEREAQARALGRERRTLRALVEAVPAGILLVDCNEAIRMLSRVGADQLGLGEPERWIGRSADEMLAAVAERLAPDDRKHLLERFGHAVGPGVEEFEVRVARPAERVLLLSHARVLSEEGARLGRLFVFRDVTGERRLAERLQRAERMETLGTLAGGVAHDFNNQLTAVLGNARSLLETLRPEGPTRDALLDLEAAAEHCAELTRGLLAFARQTPTAPRPVSLERMLHEMEGLVGPSLPPDAKLEVRLAPGTHPVLADPAQIRRVLMNLAVNARDALEDDGQIRVEARNVPGRRVEIAISDTGVGMEPHTRAHIFDPFFTTKPVGEGTGLGLAIVYGIVEAHGASIEVESEPGRGTRFRILWPAVPGESVPDPEPTPAPIRGGDELVLVADDEPVVRRLVRTTLERHGYRVLEAGDGDEALALASAHEVAAAVLDLSMPRRGGREALAAMRARRPGLPAVLMSGRLTGEDVGTARERLVVLPKPFRPAELARAIRDALDAPRGRGEESG